MTGHAMELADILQIAGWLLTVVGQMQITLRMRAGFVTWTAANAVLIALCVHAGLWWSIGMHASNALVCLWSYGRWRQDSSTRRPLLVRRTPQ